MTAVVLSSFIIFLPPLAQSVTSTNGIVSNKSADCINISNLNQEILDAAFLGHMSRAKFLIRCNGTDVNTLGIASEDFHFLHAKTPLYYASERGHAEVVKLLVAHPEIHVAVKLNTSLTLLGVASQFGRYEVVKELLAHPGVDVNQVNEDLLVTEQRTPLVISSHQGHADVTKLLLEHPQVDVNKGYISALYTESSRESVVIEKMLEHKEIDVNQKNGELERTALMKAARVNAGANVKLLLQQPTIDVNIADVEGESALYKAAFYNNTGIVKQLLNDPRVIVNKGRNSDGETPLLYASKWGYNRIIEALINNSKVDVDQTRTDNGLSPLHLAIDIESHKILDSVFRERHYNFIHGVNLLLSHPHINVNINDKLGRTPLFVLSKMRFDLLSQIEPQVEMMKLLLRHPKINVNKSLRNRTTPLMVASINANRHILRLLLSHVDIDVNFATYEGKTALFYAFSDNSYTSFQKEIVEILLQCPSVDIHLRDEEDKTAMDHAFARNRDDIIKAFKSQYMLKKIEHTCCSNQINAGLLRAAAADDLAWVKTFIVCPQLDINLGDKYGFTPLYLASREGHSQIVQAILEIPSVDVNIEVNYKTSLMIAAENDHANIVALLLSNQQVDVNKKNTGDGGSALIFASESGNLQVVKLLLLTHQIDSNTENFYGESALKKAAIKGHLRVVKLLLRCPKTQVSNQDATEVVGGEDEDIVVHKEMIDAFELRNALLQLCKTCCINTNENLIKAAIVGDVSAVRGLQECPDADINTVNWHGRSPLHLASCNGHGDVVEVLLNNPKINVNQGVIHRGDTAFSIASERGHFNIMRQLILHSRVDYAIGWCGHEWAHYHSKCTLLIAQTELKLTSTSIKISPVSESVITCNSTHFFCDKNVPKCISSLWVCDGDEDCTDSTDETDFVCATWTCPEGSFKCLDGAPMCIPQTRLCDKVIHCQDGSDESQCGTCGGSFTFSNNLISSPLYPEEYPKHSDCTYLITGSKGSYINLTVLSFNVKWVEIYICRDDLLEVRDGSSNDAPLIGKYCGEEIPPTIHSTANSIWLRFKTRRFSGPGFFMMYKEQDCEMSTREICKFNEVANSFVLHVRAKLPYEEAKVRCQLSHDAHLLEFWNEDEWNEVTKWVNSSKYFIGLTDIANEGMFLWDSGSQLSAHTTTMWQSGQPNNYQGRDDCVIVKDGRMWDVPCDSSYEFVCQKRIPQAANATTSSTVTITATTSRP